MCRSADGLRPHVTFACALGQMALSVMKCRRSMAAKVLAGTRARTGSLVADAMGRSGSARRHALPALELFVRRIPVSSRRAYATGRRLDRRGFAGRWRGAPRDSLPGKCRCAHLDRGVYGATAGHRCRYGNELTLKAIRSDSRVQWVMPSRRTTLRKVRTMIFTSNANDWRCK